MTLVDAHVYTAPENWKPGELISRGGTHGESSDPGLDHIPQIRDQMVRRPYSAPQLVIDSAIKSLADVERLIDVDKREILDTFALIGYRSWDALRGSVAV